MALGLAPKHTGRIALTGLTKEQALITCYEAAMNLGWRVGTVITSGFMAYTKLSLSSFGEEVVVELEDEFAKVTSHCTGNQLFDWGKNKSNLDNFEEAIRQIINSYSASELDYKYRELQPKIQDTESSDLTPLGITVKRLSGISSIFKPQSGYYITPVLIIINVLIFILMVAKGVNAFQPEADELIKWGGNLRHLVLQGEYWRLLSSTFIHIGVFHLLMNMYALLYIGLLLEPQLGKAKFFTAFLLTGLVASVNSIWWHTMTVSAGASGAIFGMYGLFLALLTTNHIEKAARKTMLTSIAVYITYNLINGVKEGIDNAAHVGGLISGILIGYAFFPSIKKPDSLKVKYSTIALLAVITVLGSSFALKKVDVFAETPLSEYQIDEYKKKMERFASMEAMALEVMSWSKSTPKYQILKELDERGLYYWEENITLIRDSEKLHLPEELHARNKKLLHYCYLRIKQYKLLFKAVDEETDKYQRDLAIAANELSFVINELTGNNPDTNEQPAK